VHINRIGVPQLVIGGKLSAAPNRGYERATVQSAVTSSDCGACPPLAQPASSWRTSRRARLSIQPVTDTKAVQQLFDEIASEHDQLLLFFATFGRSLAAWCALRPGERVLDNRRGPRRGRRPCCSGSRPARRSPRHRPRPSMIRALFCPPSRLSAAHHMSHGRSPARPPGCLRGLRDLRLRLPLARPSRTGHCRGPRGCCAPAALPQICAEAGFTGIEQRAERQPSRSAADGPGPADVPPEHLPHILDRFYWARPRSDRSGSGLGLAIAAETASAHGETLHVAPVSPHGLRVTLTLPSRPGLRSEPKQATSAS
jgi:hypothetical protein